MFKVSILFTATIIAFWVSSISGGGASIVLIPLLSWLLPTSVVPFSLTIGTLTSSASRIVVFRRNINWRIFFWFVPFSIPAVCLGAWFVKFVNPLYLQLIVALFLVANLPQLLKSKTTLQKTEKASPKYVLAVVGFLAGLVSGITGAIGLLFNRFYLRYGLTKEEIIATRAANEIFLHVAKLIIYIILGLYSISALYLGITVAVASVISSYTIKYILPFISEFIFKKVGYATMVVSGCILLIGTTDKIIAQDNISLHTKQVDGKNEANINWRETNFVLEYAFDDGLEVERPIHYDELPYRLKVKYNKLKFNYDKILLEKVFKFKRNHSYEFYCYKNDLLVKFEFNERE